MTDIRKFIPVNFDLLGNPVNWIIVFLMIAIAGVGLALVIQHSTPSANEETE